MNSGTLESRAINALRFLSADGVQRANSGHPGLPMGTAAIAYTIWSRFLRHNPANPQWLNRDRFVLSGGHGSMLLYSLLHLTGYDLTLDDLKAFRQWGSRTPGHPEFGLTPGVETTTGPLGQGFANGVGMGIAAYALGERLNRPGYALFSPTIYAIVTDGDLMEGVAGEAASLAGHLGLGNLVYVYDDNRISIDGETDIAFTEDRGKRFEAYGWHVSYVKDGNSVSELTDALTAAREDARPSLIVARTIIGYGLPTRAGTAKAHGEPPGKEELEGAKKALGWPLEPDFYVPEDVRSHFLEAVARGEQAEREWRKTQDDCEKKHPDVGKEVRRLLANELPEGWDKDIPIFSADAKGLATRVSSGRVINAIAPNLPDLIGGSADLHPSTKTWIDGALAFQTDARNGRNIHYGVREHAMGAVVNGMATVPGIIPFGATFLVFADYMRGAIRLSALSHFHSIWVFTHDSIGVGEDGPTHQPIEHLASLRAIPNLVVLRPMDANETAEAWRCAIQRRSGPTCLALTRQDLPTIDRSVYAPADGLARGAYVLADLGEGAPEIILMASGSEVQYIIGAGERLAAEGRSVRLVSFPSWELFEEQPAEYRESVLPQSMPLRVVVEAGVSQGWERWAGDGGRLITLNRYGASAPGEVVFRELGFTAENVYQQALDLLES